MKKIRKIEDCIFNLNTKILRKITGDSTAIPDKKNIVYGIAFLILCPLGYLFLLLGIMFALLGMFYLFAFYTPWYFTLIFVVVLYGSSAE